MTSTAAIARRRRFVSCSSISSLWSESSSSAAPAGSLLRSSSAFAFTASATRIALERGCLVSTSQIAGQPSIRLYSYGSACPSRIRPTSTSLTGPSGRAATTRAPSSSTSLGRERTARATRMPSSSTDPGARSSDASAMRRRMSGSDRPSADNRSQSNSINTSLASPPYIHTAATPSSPSREGRISSSAIRVRYPMSYGPDSRKPRNGLPSSANSSGT